MEKRKLTPLLVATIITAGIATGAHSLTVLEMPQSHTVLNKTKKNENDNDNTENETISKNNKNSKSQISKAVDSSKNSTANNSDSYIYNTPVKKEIQKIAPTHKNLPKQSFTAQKIQSNTNVDVASASINNKLSLPEGNLLVNGTKIASQLQSTPSIAAKAIEITKNCSNDYQKAQALYVWVTRNMHYSKTEENTVLNGNRSVDSSAIHAFNSREGICEDFSTLYAVMANDAGLATRVVAGQGFGNNQWVSHAWNQVYIPSMGWINVDTTFANSYVALINQNNLPFNSAGILSTEPYYTYKTAEYSYKIYTEDYFNTDNFNTTHKNAEVLAQLGTI